MQVFIEWSRRLQHGQGYVKYFDNISINRSTEWANEDRRLSAGSRCFPSRSIFLWKTKNALLMVKAGNWHPMRSLVCGHRGNNLDCLGFQTKPFGCSSLHFLACRLGTRALALTIPAPFPSCPAALRNRH